MNRTAPSHVSSALNHPVHIRAHLPYAGDGQAVDRQTRRCLDLYLPETSNFPLLFFIHGGALMMGDKRLAQHVGLGFARLGIGVVAINHRFSPQVMHPVHIEDTAQAFAFTCRQLGHYGADVSRIAVAGHSSGGYLAGLLAADPRYLQAQGCSVAEICAVIPLSGFFHVDRVAPARPKHVWGETNEQWLAASPATHAHKEMPPTLLLYADGDENDRRLESIDFAQQLKNLGVTASAQEIKGRDHRSIFFKLFSANDETTTVMSRFLSQHLKLEL